MIAEIICPTCGGSGESRDPRISCRDCAGWGAIEDPDAFEDDADYQIERALEREAGQTMAHEKPPARSGSGTGG